MRGEKNPATLFTSKLCMFATDVTSHFKFWKFTSSMKRDTNYCIISLWTNSNWSHLVPRYIGPCTKIEQRTLFLYTRYFLAPYSNTLFSCITYKNLYCIKGLVRLPTLHTFITDPENNMIKNGKKGNKRITLKHNTRSPTLTLPHSEGSKGIERLRTPFLTFTHSSSSLPKPENLTRTSCNSKINFIRI